MAGTEEPCPKCELVQKYAGGGSCVTCSAKGFGSPVPARASARALESAFVTTFAKTLASQAGGPCSHARRVATYLSMERSHAELIKSFRDRPIRKPHPDDEGWDSIQLSVEPRYKQSYGAGDGWHKKVQTTFSRKGTPILQKSYHNYDDAVKALPWVERTALEREPTAENGFTPKGIELVHKGLLLATPDLCMQPGCDQPWTKSLRIKKEYCEQGHVHEPIWKDMRRDFCDTHSSRGDSSLEDADSNYELAETRGATPVPTQGG